MEEKKYERNDAIFTLLFYPEREAKGLLDTAIAVIRKRYGERILQTRAIARVFHLLQTIPDHTVRLFALLFMIHWEPSIAKELEVLPGMFGSDQTTHFRAFMIQIGAFTDKTLQFHYNAFNAIEVVDKFVEAAKLEYVMGPL